MTPRLDAAIDALAAARLRLKNARQQLGMLDIARDISRAVVTPEIRDGSIREVFAAEDDLERKMAEVLNAWGDEPK